MKKSKIVFGTLISIATTFLVFIEFVSLKNFVKFDLLAKKVEMLAAKNDVLLEKNYDLSLFDINQESFSAKDNLSQKIQQSLFSRSFYLDRNASIQCSENSIIYKGNIEGDYFLNGKKESDFYFSDSDYDFDKEWVISKKLNLNSDGTRKRDYIPKDEKDIEKMQVIVKDSIDDVLREENLNSIYKDIQIEITSKPHFEKFISDDYDFYVSEKGRFKDSLTKFSLWLAFYTVSLLAFFCGISKRAYILKIIFSTLACAIAIVLGKTNLLIPILICIMIVFNYYALKIVTKNNFSREFYFSTLGFALAIFLNLMDMTSYFDINVLRICLYVFNFFVCIALSLTWQIILDTRISIKKENLQENLNV